MKRLLYPGAVLLSAGLLLALSGHTPAAAQCSGSMMGMCMGGENCHEPGQQCEPENCPGGMMGSCMEGGECNSGMMGNCHEGGGGGMGCQMEECPMQGECEEMMGSGHCEEGMMGQCPMSGGCCDNPGQNRDRRRTVHMVGTPNPFNPTTTVSFELPETAVIDLAIYDVASRRIARIAEGQYPAGNHSASFRANNLPSGIYFARLQTPGSVSVLKLLLMK